MKAISKTTILFAVLFVFGLTACTDGVLGPSPERNLNESGGMTMNAEAETNPVVFPNIPGNAAAECKAVSDYFDVPEFQFSLKWNEEGEIDENVEQGSPEGSWVADGNTISVQNSNGTYFDFSATSGIGAVFVKGGSGANVWYYDPQVTSDEELYAPVNSSGNPAGTSHITFCWNPADMVPCFRGETAWSAGERFTQRGNWATYTEYEDGLEVDLFAGQTHEAGTVTFEEADNDHVKITITLNAGWSLKNVDEPVKVQGYDEAPSGNPAPGKFTTYKGEYLEITVPAYAFYGIHLDVQEETMCAVEPAE